ncbi:isochorismate synthase [Microbacterium sp. TNHR37B]|uniref:isochorismate synthase n=1 Tax=Microbacterium sp. TNHR37B TaxID=1775956 RepID=UPI0007B24BF4|nr:isochorismate synthase [Microbacterium sp. TNHR37B]KZE88765.1 Isochorismate synthase DhbC [Microbacterium sp. TNHR37B]
MSAVPSRLPRLRAVTREIPAGFGPDADADLLEYADPRNPLVWSRRGDVLVGVGSVFVYVGSPGVEPRHVARAWSEVTSRAEIDDPLSLPGTGLVAFATLPFDAESRRGPLLVVPETIIGRRGGRTWLTRVSSADDTHPAADVGPGDLPARTGYGPHWSAHVGPGTLTPEDYQSIVAAGLEEIAAGTVSKVVLARDLAGTVPPGSDLRRLVRALGSSYPDTWTFAVDGLIGASPETLLTVSGGDVTARVLAGTAARGADPDADTLAAVALSTSTKDLDEHQYAVQSVLSALRPHTTALVAQEQPFMLKLPNVWHLATDVEGRLSAGASALDLIDAVHPTAAVAGTPTARALEVIRRLEPFDRGRYAGPVGWTDANGNGEWAIALRCAQFERETATVDAADGIPFTAHAGAGIVAGSDPESEMLETRVKFRPIVDALA